MNFLNPERKVKEIAPGTALAWNSVTTGNLAGIDLWLDDARTRHARASRPTSCPARWIWRGSTTTRSSSTAAGLAGSSASIDCRKRIGAGALRSSTLSTFAGGADLPVYLRVTQADGHQAWSSPIYLIA